MASTSSHASSSDVEPEALWLRFFKSVNKTSGETVQLNNRLNNASISINSSTSSLVAPLETTEAAINSVLVEANRSILTVVTIESVESPPLPLSIPPPVPAPVLNSPPPACGVCFEQVDESCLVTIPICGHNYCKTCLSTFLKLKLKARKYPIRCPYCEAMDMTGRHSLPDSILESLELSSEDTERLHELQLLTHASLIHCGRCKQEMYVDREQFEANDIVSCPLPSCQYSWCKSCSKEVSPCDKSHTCVKNKKLHRLAKRKGWKPCPGCGVLVDKTVGCNHMMCTVPRCSVHFCFRCGGMIFDPAINDYIGEAITVHYLNCRQYERWYTPRRIGEACSIQ
ncbi:hypothetical protein CPB83DRAFT_786403 [Crepidotus variabilis]|uniref:Uncharacterized protein n=1 Tax=Crepidotus variabilis TaxID=179855 RepID=A0A9P6JS90_9AGAR|nr:hypothetical protein CPB83DRAFT_786403 [Crepidotus variabilis]